MAEKKTAKGNVKKEEKKDSHKNVSKPVQKTTGAKHEHAHVHSKDEKHAHGEAKEMKAAKKVVPVAEGEKGKGKIAEKVDKGTVLHAYQTLIYPLITEKAINMIEAENKLVFVVKGTATKQDVKKAVEELYGVKVDSVNMMRDTKARKRAFVRINEKYKADEIATKLGVL
jgi:ribosomal protein uL23